ncbi:MAG: sel1 repeat family protein [Lachnospiraceae bacterium]|nr:sel1 repeat family protein [Lachnospiraceae bacterium]
MDEGLKNLIAKAERGDVEAMVMVGDCYNRGFHTDKDDSMAQAYYKRAADYGHIGASFMVGLGYLYGTGVKKNKVAAAKYIQLAADNGLANAQYVMGLMYLSGDVGAFFKNQNAAKYYEKAAKQGHADAQYDLGEIYFTEWSKGNKHRFDDGLFWMLCAALHSSEKSLKTRNKARNFIDSAIIQRGYPVESIKEVIAQIRRNHPDYINDPK